MTKDQLLEFVKILGVEYQLKEHRHRKPKDMVIACPFAPWFHNHKVDRNLGNASIRVNKMPHLFHCFTCKQGSGPLPKMVEALRNAGLSSDKCNKLMKLATSDELDFGIMDKFPFEKDDDGFDVIRMSKYTRPSAEVYSYLVFRGVDLSVVDKYEIMQDRSYMVLPMKNYNGDIVGAAKRLILDSDYLKRWIYETTTRAELCLYGEQFMETGDDAILVEGQVDVLYLDGMIPGVIPLGANGSDLSEYQINSLKRLGSLTLMGDNDAAGAKLNSKAKKLLSKHVPLMFEAVIPEEFNDPANTPKDVLKRCFDERVVI